MFCYWEPVRGCDGAISDIDGYVVVNLEPYGSIGWVCPDYLACGSCDSFDALRGWHGLPFEILEKFVNGVKVRSR